MLTENAMKPKKLHFTNVKNKHKIVIYGSVLFCKNILSKPCRHVDLLGLVLKCNLYGKLFIPLMAMKQIYWLQVGSAIDNR